jgi:hypothetical protein
MVIFFALSNFFLFPGHYGTISQNMVFTGTVDHSAVETGINMLMHLLILCVVLFLLFFNTKLKNVTIKSIPVVLILALSISSLVNIVKIHDEFIKMDSYITNEQINATEVNPIFHLSKTGKNVVVIMLDMAESVFVPHIFEESPDLLEKYRGFVYYPNTVTFNGYTKGGAPPIFGGYEYSPEEINKRDTVSLVEKTNAALLLMPRLFSSADWGVTVTDPPYANNNWIADLSIYGERISAYTTDSLYTDIWLSENNIDLPSTSSILTRDIVWYSIFRIMPLLFRPGIYDTGSWCSLNEMQRLRGTLNGYSVLDYLPRLTDCNTEYENTALFMVNNTTHENSFLQAPEYRPINYVTNYGASKFKNDMPYHVNAAALKRIGEWFDYLRTEQVYDNTRIILVSDHGFLDNSFVTKTNLPFSVDQYNPVLLVKDFMSGGYLQTDSTFMSNADVPVLAMKGIFENPKNPFTGNTITSEYKKNKLRIVTGRLEDKNDTQYRLGTEKDYYVHDNIFDPTNWSTAGK